MSETKTQTKSTLSEFFGYFMWITLLVVSFVWGRSCESKSSDKQYTKAWADSVARKADSAVGFWQARYEMERRDGERDNEVIKNLTAETEYYKGKMQSAEKSAQRWHTQFKQAKELKDTVTMVSACDSALPRYLEALDYAHKRHENDSSKILILTGNLERKDALLSLADSTLKQVQASNVDMKNAIHALNKEKKKRKFWRWVERVGIAASTAFVFTR